MTNTRQDINCVFELFQVQDVLLLQPLKVFFMSLVVAKFYKKIEDKGSETLSKDAKKLAKDERY